jgi:copper oxidase (laccase) domain-containing protein
MTAKQAHSGVIMWVDEASPTAVADGVAVHADNAQPLVIRTADCLPLVLLSPEVACVLHVSRKTLVKGLLDQVPNFIVPGQITKVFIGPHICAEHFVFEKMGPEIQEFQQKYPYACRETVTGLSLDINRVVEEYLKSWNVDEALLSRDGRCTFESPELPSYRRSLRDNQPLSDAIATIVRSA